MESEASPRRRSTRQSLKRGADESVEDLQRSTSLERLVLPSFGGESTKSAEKKRRKKRRSSFVNIVGRKSGDFLRPVNKLCESIPKNLAEEERLEKLALGALDYAFMNIQHQNSDLDLGSLRTKVRDAGINVIQDLKEQGQFAKACETRRTENPINIQNQKIASAYEKRIKTLTKEANAWDKQLEKAKNLCQKAQKQVDEMDDNPIRLPPKTLTPEQRSILDEVTPDHDRTQLEVNTVRDRLVMYVKELESCVSGLHLRHQISSAELTRLTQKLHDSIKHELTDPREVITSLIDTWKTPCPPYSD